MSRKEKKEQAKKKEKKVEEKQEESKSTSVEKVEGGKSDIAEKNTLKETLMKLYATGDKKLNEHIFGSLPLKVIDFKNPEIYALFKNKRPVDKKEIVAHQYEKLKILIACYDSHDFDMVKFHALNSEQIL